MNATDTCLQSPDRILAAAETLFAEHGFEGVSVQAIAARAGVSKSNVFHHFSSKQELYLEVLRAAHREFSAAVRTLSAGGGTAGERLGRYASAHLDCVFRHGPLTRLVLRDLFDDSRARELAEKVFGEDFAELTGLIAAGQARGELRAGVDPALAAFLLVAADAFYFHARPALRHLPGVDFADAPAVYGQGVADVLLHGLVAAGSGYGGEAP